MSQDCFFVVTNAPKSFDFGMDCMCYETGPSFSGVSLVPPGLHLIYHSTGMGSRMGFFAYLDKGEVIAREWIVYDEELLPYSTLSEDSMAYLRQSIQHGELNSNLGPYSLDLHASWVNLSNFISIDRVLPRANCSLNTNISPGEAEDMIHLQQQSKASNPSPNTTDEVSTPAKSTLKGNKSPQTPRFSNIEATEKNLLFLVKQSENNTYAMTALYLDKSEVVTTLVESYFGRSWEDLLGEFQLCFLLFIMLYSFPALQQWKKLVDTLSRCEQLATKKPSFFAAFIRVFYEQLSFCPSDFFEAELSKDNFLRSTMTCLFENLSTSNLSPSLVEHRKRLLSFLQKKFGLFEQESGAVYSAEGVLLHADRFALVEEDLPVLVVSPDKGTDKISGDMQGSEVADDSIKEAFTARVAGIRSAIDGASLHYNQSFLQFDSGDMHRSETFGLSSSPISVAVEDKAGTTSLNAAPSTAPSMTPVEIETAMYCWRYPALYDAMQTGEDLTMTAVRLFEEEESRTTGISSRAFLEARMFVEEEVSRRSGIPGGPVMASSASSAPRGEARSAVST